MRRIIGEVCKLKVVKCLGAEAFVGSMVVEFLRDEARCAPITDAILLPAQPQPQSQSHRVTAETDRRRQIEEHSAIHPVRSAKRVFV
jgi:hypothetical protein